MDAKVQRTVARTRIHCHQIGTNARSAIDIVRQARSFAAHPWSGIGVHAHRVGWYVGQQGCGQHSFCIVRLLGVCGKFTFGCTRSYARRTDQRLRENCGRAQIPCESYTGNIPTWVSWLSGEFWFCIILILNILHLSYVFWFGDLNFRLTGEASTSPTDIKELVDRDRLDELIEKDQLSMIRRQGRAFTQLEERLPAFPPTFKFEHGTNDYDLRWLSEYINNVILSI